MNNNSKPKKPILRILSKYDIIKVYKSEKDIEIGLLRYKNIPYNAAFLFKFKDEDERSFHTVGMKFNIDIYFFDKTGVLINKYENCRPDNYYNSYGKCKYIVETKSIIQD